ncbi:MAG: tyrosine--tRNA ligase, partial [Nonomuraea sp.]|nr:tyrosine--tRNA ligase [Nonomuraea sp.]
MNRVTSTTDEILNHFARTTQEIVSLDEFRELLDSGRRLRIKYGVDCTAPFLHLGHAVNLWMMRYLQERGHKVVFLLGDMTTRIGDPTGRSHTRPVITADEIERNAKAFQEQVATVLLTDPEVFEVRRNSEWFGAMPVADLIGIFSQVTHAHLVSRDMFRERIAANHEIGLHELCYPVLQGYDSYAMESDVTIVGTDQLFNEMMGRHYQQRFGMKPQVIITSQITPGIDGRAKQSKSLGNYIALIDTPADKFGKSMSISDDLVTQYMRVYTDIPLDEIEQADTALRTGGRGARDAKVMLAKAVVSRYHGNEVAERLAEEFAATFSQGRPPADMEEIM